LLATNSWVRRWFRGLELISGTMFAPGRFSQ